MKLLLVLVLIMHSQSQTFATFVETLNSQFSAITSAIESFFIMVRDSIKREISKKQVRHHVRTMEERGRDLYESTVKSLITTIIRGDEGDEVYNQLKTEPTSRMSTDHLIMLHGKRVRRHQVVTKDGYLLLVFQIVVSRSSAARNRSVLLHHGLLGSSSDWLMLGANRSLPHLLCDAGYDVWLTNARGNRYSRAHENMKAENFWNFTFQEMGKYDLRAVVDYIIVKKNNSMKIDFIGHSMGASALMVLLSTYPAYNTYLRMGILLAPLVFMANIQGPIKVLSETDVPPSVIYKALGYGEFYPRRIPNAIAKRYCAGPIVFCRNALFFMAGVMQSTPLDDWAYVARVSVQVPAGGSTHTIMHYAQLARSARFHEYGRPTSEFPLKKVTLPIVIFNSDTDWLSTTPDATRLYVNIQNPMAHIIFSSEKLSHTEFVWGDLAPKIIFPKVMTFLENKTFKDVNRLNEV